ncbi:unnamed protein product [Dibothriocephalus latus]|uniref:Uncharacterized protein n=1 Tax=Dibothriocephalus latus TaxID=60516 RepID=A0A3P6PZW1_DIBLA|nr:unnamed protein product [Dibothriocephalus latus]
MWATPNLAASIHLEKPCAFNFVNVAGPKRHNILVEITGLSFTGDIDSAMTGRLDEDSSERDFTEEDVMRAEAHCLRLTWVDHVDDFNVTYHESNRARRVVRCILSPCK